MTDVTPALRIAKTEGDTPEIPRTVIFTGTEKVLREREDGSTYFETVDKEFTIENRARPSLTFGYMRRLRAVGQEAAEAWMLEMVLGDEALAYLEAQDDMTDKDSDALMKRIRQITSGGAQGPKVS